MSENIPESIPTSADPRSHRPAKRARGPATAVSSQANAVENLFAQPDKDVYIPTTATKGPKSASSIAAPPEIVANVQGSSAGAGSGEFHVYKASRRREFERIRLMEEEAAREEANKEWQQKQEELKKKDETGKSKAAKKREKAKARKEAMKGVEKENGQSNKKGKLGPNPTLAAIKEKEEDDEAHEPNGTRGTAAPEEPGITFHEDD